MKVRLTQIDGKLPNLALMKLAHYHKSKGDDIYFQRGIMREMFEPAYDVVYGSAIFSSSEKKIGMFKSQFPAAVVGGTGTGEFGIKVEDIIGCKEYEYENYDYCIYPNFTHSIGFTQRGCRLRCSFCVVPRKEGKNVVVNSINDIWRGEGFEKKLHLLDNDFFGQELWEDRCKEILDGGFKICLNQGINVRLIHKEGAAYLAKMQYFDDQFKTKRIYTAWDNRRDEGIFFKGINILMDAGIRPGNIMVYMLCGYWPNETFDDIYYRFEMMDKMGLLPYPMVYGENKELKRFQRWVVRRYYKIVSWEDYKTKTRREYWDEKDQSAQTDLFN